MDILVTYSIPYTHTFIEISNSILNISIYIHTRTRTLTHYTYYYEKLDVHNVFSGTKEESVISSEGTVKRTKVSLPKSTTILKV